MRKILFLCLFVNYLSMTAEMPKAVVRGKNDISTNIEEDDIPRTVKELFAKFRTTIATPKVETVTVGHVITPNYVLFPNILHVLRSGNYGDPKFLGIDPLEPIPESEMEECL